METTVKSSYIIALISLTPIWKGNHIAKAFSMVISEFHYYDTATKGPVFSFKESNTDVEESEYHKTIFKEGKVFPFVCE